MQNGYTWLVIAGALNSTVSLYYYLLILKRMYIFDPRPGGAAKIALPAGLTLALLLAIAGILILGVFPSRVIELTRGVALELFR
jgi:NADH:ubiquinone oxidoreductase subunit 2 (subunit N)